MDLFNSHQQDCYYATSSDTNKPVRSMCTALFIKLAEQSSRCSVTAVAPVRLRSATLRRPLTASICPRQELCCQNCVNLQNCMFRSQKTKISIINFIHK